jgi:hypothetical protein
VPTRIVGTAFRLLQHDKKNSFRIKETCMRRLCAHRSMDRAGAEAAAPPPRARRRADRAMRSLRIAETPANWAFHPCRKIRAQPATHGLTAFSTRRRRRGTASPSALFATKKNSAYISVEGSFEAHRVHAEERDSRESAPPIRKRGCSDRSCKRLTRRFGGLRRVDSRLRGGQNAATPCAVISPPKSDRAWVRDRASP